MSRNLRPYITRGISIVGATSLLAATVITAVPTHAHEPAPRQVTMSVESMSHASQWELFSEPALLFRGFADSVVEGIDDPTNPLSLGVDAWGETSFLVGEHLGFNVPTYLPMVIEHAIDNPEDAPGSLSLVIHCILLLEPSDDLNAGLDEPIIPNSLLYRSTYPIVEFLVAVLPEPLGDLVVAAYEAVGSMVKQFLALLPEPVIPQSMIDFGVATHPRPGEAEVEVPEFVAIGTGDVDPPSFDPGPATPVIDPVEPPVVVIPPLNDPPPSIACGDNLCGDDLEAFRAEQEIDTAVVEPTDVAGTLRAVEAADVPSEIDTPTAESALLANQELDTGDVEQVEIDQILSESLEAATENESSVSATDLQTLSDTEPATGTTNQDGQEPAADADDAGATADGVDSAAA